MVFSSAYIFWLDRSRASQCYVAFVRGVWPIFRCNICDRCRWTPTAFPMLCNSDVNCCCCCLWRSTSKNNTQQQTNALNACRTMRKRTRDVHVSLAYNTRKTEWVIIHAIFKGVTWRWNSYRLIQECIRSVYKQDDACTNVRTRFADCAEVHCLPSICYFLLLVCLRNWKPYAYVCSVHTEWSFDRVVCPFKPCRFGPM